jgi:tetratricopeptide (TPR) repeat protein
VAASKHPQYALLAKAEALIDDDPDAAHRIVNNLLNDDPDDPLALFVAASIYARGDRMGIALQLFRRCCQLAPHRDEAWNNVGMALSGVQRFREARDAFLEAIKRDGKNAGYVANVAMTYLEENDYKAALRWADKALALEPGQAGATQTAGFASLALGDWDRGWKGYDRALGGKFRKVVKLDDEPQWDGKPTGTLFVYGEQGLGDELMMASCLPDAMRDAGKVVLECDARLEGLLKRSFPTIDVYGTRKQKRVEWPAKYDRIDAGCAIGQLPLFYRPTPAACPGTPYLNADPERVIQWRALLDSLGDRPKIGLCWSGGRRWTNAKGRAMGLEALRPLIESLDADFVSLQHTDASDEIAATGLPVKHWPHATQTQDYDDTAALVANLDMVIGVHTAVHHLAGALGVPAVVLVPERGIWIWNLDPMPWYRSARIFRQRAGEPWTKTVKRLASDDSIVGGLRPAGSGGVSHLLPISDRPDNAAGGVQAADVALAA